MHNITNQYARVDGDDAEVWSYAVAIHLGAPESDQADLTMGVQYRDRCTRTDAGWIISARETVKLWSRGSFPQRFRDGVPAVGPPGQRFPIRSSGYHPGMTIERNPDGTLVVPVAPERRHDDEGDDADARRRCHVEHTRPPPR